MLVFLRKVIVDLLVSGGPEPAVTSGQPEDLRWPFAHRYSAAAAPAHQPETAKRQKITHTPPSIVALTESNCRADGHGIISHCAAPKSLRCTARVVEAWRYG